MPDVVDLIKQDHREVERLFETLRTDPAKRPGLVPVLTTLLTAHSRAEEAEVYPVCASEAEAAEEVSHSQEEHVQADELLARLADCDPESSEFETCLDELVEAVTHHVEEEESKVLPAMSQQLTDERRAKLGEAFLASRAQHLGEQPGEMRKEELVQQAQNVGISTSGKSKEELERELKRRAG